MPAETPYRIEPTRLETVPEVISDLVAELAAATARLDRALNPRTAASLADLVRIMNTYYSNLIEGHNTRPRDIERAIRGDFAADRERRNLQVEALGHIRVQREIDKQAVAGTLSEPASSEYLRWLHREFYRDAAPEQLRIRGNGPPFAMTPGEWRSRPDHDVAVGRHVPPASAHVEEFMTYFESHYKLEPLGKSARILAIPTAHHRFNFIHPFPDGNGRVSRLMSHAMAHRAGIGAHGLWSISRGLARGLDSRVEYRRMMDLADSPREGDLDGRGNLSQHALAEFVHWFLRICLDQVSFMSRLFDLDTLMQRLRTLVERSGTLKPESARLLEEALLRGEVERGEMPRLTGLPERSARRVFNDVLEAGLLGSDTPKGPVSLRLPADTVDVLFPRLFPEA
ncbi:MAG: Fic family protein [Gammaproteobacteria bacterium]|nr:Fic family protein [Gammaproteobacteria bacterium]